MDGGVGRLQMHSREVVGGEGQEGEKEGGGGGSRRPEESGSVNNASTLA